MWAAVRAWLKAGGALPDDPELEVELTQVEYGFNARRAPTCRGGGHEGAGFHRPTSPTPWRSPSPTRWHRVASAWR